MKEYFAVLNVSRDDLINVVDKSNKELVKTIENLSDDDMGRIARKVGNYIYDGDSWDNACRDMIHNLNK